MAKSGRRTNASIGKGLSSRKYSTGTLFQMEGTDFDALQKAMLEYGAGSGQIVADVFEDYGAPLIREEIKRLIPESGRTWRGKKKAAKQADSLMSQVFRTADPSIYTRSRPAYGYLYFPDDGSYTKRHVGNQNFMGRGQDAATNRIIDRCLAKLADNF